MTKDGTACILVQKDDLLRIRQDTTVNELFTTIQGPSSTSNASARNRGITNKGDHYEISLSKDYTTTMLEKAGMTTYETTITQGTAANKASNYDNENTPANRPKKKTCALQTRWKAPTDDTHKTRPELCNARASNSQHTSN